LTEGELSARILAADPDNPSPVGLGFGSYVLPYNAPRCCGPRRGCLPGDQATAGAAAVGCWGVAL